MLHGDKSSARSQTGKKKQRGKRVVAAMILRGRKWRTKKRKRSRKKMKRKKETKEKEKRQHRYISDSRLILKINQVNVQMVSVSKLKVKM